MTVRRSPIFANDIRRLGGVVTVVPVRDPTGGDPAFTVSHVSRGGDCAFASRAIADEDQARAAARVLAEFVGGAVRL
jgi:hypothetical protein